MGDLLGHIGEGQGVRPLSPQERVCLVEHDGVRQIRQARGVPSAQSDPEAGDQRLRVLNVAVSTYYGWRSQAANPSRRRRDDAELAMEIADHR